MQRQNCGKEVISVGGGSFFKRNFLYVLKQIHHETCDYYQFGNKMEAEINDYGRIIKVGIRVPAMLAVDYECNQYSDEWNFENRGIKFWSKTKEFIGYAEGRNR